MKTIVHYSVLHKINNYKTQNRQQVSLFYHFHTKLKADSKQVSFFYHFQTKLKADNKFLSFIILRQNSKLQQVSLFMFFFRQNRQNSKQTTSFSLLSFSDKTQSRQQVSLFMFFFQTKQTKLKAGNKFHSFIIFRQNSKADNKQVSLFMFFFRQNRQQTQRSNIGRSKFKVLSLLFFHINSVSGQSKERLKRRVYRSVRYRAVTKESNQSKPSNHMYTQ